MSIAIGSLDRVTVVIGEKGMGKSTFAIGDARNFRKTTGGYVIGHSPNGQIGAAPDIEFHDDLRRMARGLKRRPGQMHVVALGPAEPVITYGDGMARAIKRRAFKSEYPFKRYNEARPAPKGLAAPPVLVVVDEGVSMKRHPTHEELADLERLLTSARHKHLAITWSSQAPTARQWVLLEQASRLRIFRYTHEYGLNAIRAAGVPKDIIPELPGLPPFVYYSHDKANPQSAGFRKLPAP